MLDAVAYRKSQGKLSAAADKLPIPAKLNDIGVIRAEDIKAIAQTAGPCRPAIRRLRLYAYRARQWLGEQRVQVAHLGATRGRSRLRHLREPGYGISACEYFGSRDIALQGGDASSNEAQPFGEEDGYAVPCHTANQTRRGIWNIENLDLKPLADAKVTSSRSSGRRCEWSVPPALPAIRLRSIERPIKT